MANGHALLNPVVDPNLTTPSTMTVKWDWETNSTPLSATVYVSLKNNNTYGPWEPAGDVLFVSTSTPGECIVSGLSENSTYGIRILELMSDFTTNTCDILNATTASNYILKPNAAVTQEWYVRDHQFIKDNSISTYIEARVNDGDNDVEQIYGFDDPTQDWGIKKLEVHLVAERDGTIDELEVNVRIKNTPTGTPQAFAEPHFVSLPLTFPSTPIVLPFEYGEWAGQYGGAWSKNQIKTLELILIAHGLGAGTHRVKVATVSVKTFEEL